LHEWIAQPLLPDKTITRIKGQTCVKLLPKKLLGSFSLIQREVGIYALPDFYRPKPRFAAKMYRRHTLWESRCEQHA
jgi:hypothetical protein